MKKSGVRNQELQHAEFTGDHKSFRDLNGAVDKAGNPPIRLDPATPVS
ncbi:MAG: hypothetical protein QOE88_906 [Verrucomicrobiota bacterium]|jgi:hypothetical protein|nr:hypothetical protein [Verrucomicrobiota bacterium]MEA3163088.1 hypothetical protein [Verrucomicrobiota bacterium]